jgi:NAD(P)-dependent dehydrogenase (short-subunit alcohol dehydrogenase family)
VEALGAQGVSVTFSDLSEDGAQTEAACAKNGLQVQFVQGDMADEAFCRRLALAARQRWRRVDILVNNAFSFLTKGLDASRADWLRMMNVGPFAFAKMAQEVVPSMREQGGGAIVNISSISAHIAQPNRWTYNSAKGAINQLTRCMAMDLAPYNIRVNTVSPGWTWTREVEKAALGGRDKWEPVWGRFHMLRRLARVEEVAAPVVFLCSNAASFITAAELPVDGGYLGLGPEGLGETSSFAGSQ